MMPKTATTAATTMYLAVLGALLTLAPALTVNATAAGAPATEAEEVPLTGPAWRIADQAYRAYAQGDYDSAIRNAKEAIRLRPDVPRLKALLAYAEQGQRRRNQPAGVSAPRAKAGTSIVGNSGGTAADVALLKKLDALQAQQEYEVALALAEQGTHAPGQHPVLVARVKQLRSMAAMQATTAALKAEQDGDSAAALAAIRSAPAYDPETPQYRLMLIKLLNQNQDPAGAYAAAKLALAINSDDAMTQTYTAYLLQQRGDRAQAKPLFQKALKSDELGDADLRNLRLIAADAALSAADAPAALDALAPLKDSDGEVRERRALANAMGGSASAFRPELAAPQLRCVVNRFGPVCSLFAGAGPAQQMAAAAYRAQGDQHLPEALALLDEAQRVAGPTPALEAQRKQILGGMARGQATIAFKALAENQPDVARAALQQAIGFAPDVMAYRMMEIDILVQKKDYPQAEKLANAAMQVDAGDVTPLVMRGYLRQVQGDLNAARKDYQTAMASKDLSDANRVDLGLFVADALMAGGDNALAGSVLAQLPASDPQVTWRSRLVAIKGPRPALNPPALDYRATPYETICAIKPSPFATDALVAAVFRAMSDRDGAQAVALARLLTAAAPENDNYQRVYELALTQAGELREARQVRSKLGDSVPSLDFAYMAQRASAPEVSSQTFKEIDQAGKLPDRALRDAGYAAMDANDRPAASAYLRRSVDAAHDGSVPLTEQQLFEVRRTIEQLDRQWGGYASLNYRGASPQSGPANSSSDDSAQLGAEAYWRPEQFNKNGRYVDLYGRLTANVYSKSDGISTGGSSLLGALGVRVKPLASQNLILAAERLVPLGSQAQSDWLLRAAYSYGLGTDLRFDANPWTMAQVYAEAGRYLNAGTNYFTSEGQLGRSYRLSDAWPKHSVFSPYLVLGVDYNEGFTRREAIGAGVGVSYRYWFNEDRYTAPRSYFDINLQYRVRVSGDDRAGGIVLRATITR